MMLNKPLVFFKGDGDLGMEILALEVSGELEEFWMGSARAGAT